MKIDISPDVISRIQTAFERRGVSEVTLKREKGQITVLAVRRETIQNQSVPPPVRA